MAKKDNQSHHDKGITKNYNRGENKNSFVMRGSPQLDQQHIVQQNLAQNTEEGNRHYAQMKRELEEPQDEFKVEDS